MYMSNIFVGRTYNQFVSNLWLKCVMSMAKMLPICAEMLFRCDVMLIICAVMLYISAEMPKYELE